VVLRSLTAYLRAAVPLLHESDATIERELQLVRPYLTWRDGGKPAEAVVRTPLKELLEQLDAEQFAQVHRSVVVNLRAISHVKRHDNETAEIHLKGRDDVLPVSRNYLHLFRQM